MYQNLKQLFSVLDRWKWRYVAAGLLMIAGIALQSLEPRVLQIAIDSVIRYFSSEDAAGNAGNDFVSRFFQQMITAVAGNEISKMLAVLGLALVLTSLLRGGLALGSSLLRASSTEKAIKHLRDRLFFHVQQLPMSYFTIMPKGDLIQRSTGDIQTVRGFIDSHIVEVMRTVALFGFSFSMMTLINLKYALIAVTFSPLIVLASYQFFKRERKVWEKRQIAADALDTVVQENLNGIRTVQAFANESYETGKFARLNSQKLDIDLRHLSLHAFFWPASDFLVNAQMTLTVIAGGYFAATGLITIGELISFYAYSTMLSWPMRQFGRILSRIGVGTVAIGRIYEVLNARTESRSGLDGNIRLRGEIEFRDVCFRYDKNARENVLNRVSFIIRPGEKVAFVGPTGAGKSTIVNLLVGLYHPDSGQVLVDGQQVEDYSPQFLRRKIGFVLQAAFLFSTTVKRNIAYAEPEAEMQTIEKFARIAQAHQLESVLPQGYETMVGEKGVTLSGGQKQRVALARTLLTVPDILVLDDVTSAVDTETEQAMFTALNDLMQQKTTIIISHRVTSIQQADWVFVINGGRIVQEGTHAELAQRPGYYRDIHLLQTALEGEIQQNIIPN